MSMLGERKQMLALNQKVEFCLPRGKTLPPPSPSYCKSEGSSPGVVGHQRFFRQQNNNNTNSRPQSSMASISGPSGSDKEDSPPFMDTCNKGFNFLLSNFSEKVESNSRFKEKAKSQLNLGGSDKLSDLPPLQTPSPKCKRERSLSVNSYLLSPSHALSISPPLTTQNTKYSSLNPSPRNSPRNFSLPANKLFFFPSTFTTDLIPVSRRTSANSDNSSRTPLSSRTCSPTPNYSKATSFYNFNRSRSPSPCVSPLLSRSGATYSTPLPRRNPNRNLSLSIDNRRKLSLSEAGDTDELMSVLGLDPKLYLEGSKEKEEKLPDNHLGRVYYNLRYDVTSETLAVRILNIKNIPKNNKDIGMVYKTYISICLVPDERSERRAYQATNTFSDHNPIFNECFFFQVSPQDMDDRILKLKIYNIDVNRKHRIIGQVLCCLKDLDWSKSSKVEMAQDISKYTRNSFGDKCSELLLSLSYNPSISRLTANVLEAKDLRCTKKDEHEIPPDTFVRVALSYHTKVVKVKKTGVVRADPCPQFSQSFHFKVQETLLDISSLSVTVFESKSLLERDRVLGSCVLGGCMFARGKGEEHWEQVIKFPKQHIEMWHPLVPKTENKKGREKAKPTAAIEHDPTSASF